MDAFLGSCISCIPGCEVFTPRSLIDPAACCVQALLLCRLWAAATAALPTLRPGCDADYLAAQLLWRSGDVGAAAQRLHASIDGRGACPPKSDELLRMLEPWRKLDRQSALAYEDGESCGCLTLRWVLCAPGNFHAGGRVSVLYLHVVGVSIEICSPTFLLVWRQTG